VYTSGAFSNQQFSIFLNQNALDVKYLTFNIDTNGKIKSLPNCDRGKKTSSKLSFDNTLTKRNSSPNWKGKLFTKLEMTQKI
jgi:hypothetical protein